MERFTINSSSFRNDQPVPVKFSRDGGDISPALKWEGAPSGTKNFALICDDPDAPGGTWVHWLIYGIPGDSIGLKENVSKTETVSSLGGVKQGLNSYGSIGYALDAELNLAPRVTRQQLEAAMKGHIIAEADLVGTFVRE